MRVLIGEDQALMREGLAHIFRSAGFDVVGAAADADRLVQIAVEHEPDLVVTDVRMPPRNADDGLAAALRIRAGLRRTAMLILSQYVQQRYAAELLAEGAEGVGYLLKQRVADVEAFCADARRVAGGGTVLDPEVVAAMLHRNRRGRSLDGLTARQREVLALMAEGRSNAAIAERLTLTEKAVVKHVSHIYNELGLAPSPEDHRRVLAVVGYLTG